MLALSCYPERQEMNTETKAVDEAAKRPEELANNQVSISLKLTEPQRDASA